MSTELTLRAMNQMYDREEQSAHPDGATAFTESDLAHHVAAEIIQISDGIESTEQLILDGLRREFQRALQLQSCHAVMFENLSKEARDALLSEARLDLQHMSCFADMASNAIQSIAQGFSARLQRVYENSCASR